ncbi:MAG: hypothetical protein QXO51_07965 [Halobacteria archaeon]
MGGGVTGSDGYGLIILQAVPQNHADGQIERLVSAGRDKVDKSVLAYFSATKETSLQDILKQTDLSYATLYTRLKGLTRDGLLLRRRAGWRHLFRLNPAHPVVQKHLELVEVARCSSYLAGHPKREAVLALLEEGAAATPLLTALLLNGHGPAPSSGPVPLAAKPQGGPSSCAPGTPSPALPASAGPAGKSGNGTSSGGDAKGHVGVVPASPPPPPPDGNGSPAPAAHDGELVFVVTEPEFAPKLNRLAPKARAAGLRIRVQTPAEFRALVPYLNGSVPLAGTDYFLREKLKIQYPGSDFAVQAGNGFLSVFVGAPEREFTIQDVQAATRKSYKPTYFALQKLQGWGLLAHRREKWKHYFRLNLSNPVVRKHLELEELRRGRASLAGLPSPERLAVGDLINKAVQAIPLLSVLHRQSREGPTLYFVVQKRNGHGHALQPLWAAANLSALKPRLIEVKSLRALLGRGQNHFGVLYGEEFYLSLKLKALTNGNRQGPEPANHRESPGSGPGGGPSRPAAAEAQA